MRLSFRTDDQNKPDYLKINPKARVPSLVTDRGIITETRKVIRYYNERLNNDRRLEQILVVGSGSNVPGIGDYFTNELVMPARTANPSTAVFANGGIASVATDTGPHLGGALADGVGDADRRGAGGAAPCGPRGTGQGHAAPRFLMPGWHG